MSDAPSATPTESPPAGSWWPLVGLVAVMLLVRGGILWLQYDNLRQDPDAYRLIARTLVYTGTYGYPDGSAEPTAIPTAYRPPAYPLVLVKIGATDHRDVLSVALLHLGLGLATVLVTWWIGRQWELGPLAYAAALLVAVDPILLQQSTLVMTETLATFLATVALACLTRYTQSPSFYWAGLCGGALALAMLCRPTFAVWLVLVALPVTLTPEDWGRRIGNALAFVLVALAVLAPWGVRNALVMGRPIVTTTHGGYTLWLGNNGAFYSHVKRMEGWTSPYSPPDISERMALPPHYEVDRPSIEGELQCDLLWTEDARDAISRDPPGFSAACVYRVTRLWGVLPLATGQSESTGRGVARYCVAMWYIAMLALAAYGLWSLGWKMLQSPWLWGVLLCLAFTLVHTLYWTDLRMRAPLTPMIALTAAFGLMTIAGRWVGKSEAGEPASAA